MEKIDASPTKEFFINMLTRDVVLDKAILDLIDNSVDAAHRFGDLKNRKIEIVISSESFSIIDNCGGIDKHTATEYAFRFGRSLKTPPTPNSVGQFGVGMKRTLFKIGRNFEIISFSEKECFKVNIDVDAWLADESQWEFELEEIQTRDNIQNGTHIVVNNVYDSVSEQFSLDTFVREVITEIGKAHFRALREGMTIVVNEEEVIPSDLKIINAENLSAVGREFDVDGVQVRIVAGISDRDFNEAGWYIVCNGRLIESAETSYKTGWGVDGVRKYHPDLAYFRGLVEMNAVDASKLPWTTTKSGVDIDNMTYRRVLNEMKSTMREVIVFLIDRAKEDKDFRDEKITERPINGVIEDNGFVDIYEVATLSTSLVRPDKTTSINPNPVTTVQYKVLVSDAATVKNSLGVFSNKEIGEETFKYYFDSEC